MSSTYCAHSAGVLDLSKVCQGMGLPIDTRKVLSTFLYISSTRNSIATLNLRFRALQIFAIR